MQFHKNSVIQWRRTIWRELVKQGFIPQRHIREMNAGMTLIAVAHFGTDPSTVSEITGLSVATIKRILKRLRQQKILRGQTMRVTGWDDEGFAGTLGLLLDVMSAAGEVKRVADPKRSAAQKTRKPETYARGLTHSRRPKTLIPTGTLFTPQQVRVQPLFTLEDETRKRIDANGGRY